jgi:hypothetical protein
MGLLSQRHRNIITQLKESRELGRISVMSASAFTTAEIPHRSELPLRAMSGLPAY